MKFNVFVYASNEEKLFETNLEQTGYKRLTTFYFDLSMAEWYGKDSIKETYEIVCEEWIDDYKYFTEFVMCLNRKSWEHFHRGDNEMSRLYSDLYYQARDLFYEHYEGDDSEKKKAVNYFFEMTD